MIYIIPETPIMSRRYSRTSDPRSRRSIGKSRDREYSRSSDCWNCGLPHHKSKNCTAEKILRCSFCRKRGVRSDECSCRKRKGADRRRERGESRQQEREGNSYEACLMVSICGKKVRAIVHSGEQESRMGRKVLSWIKKNTDVVTKKKVIKTISGLELASTMVVDMGIRRYEKFSIECIIDNRLPVNEMTLGMRALVKMGYHFKVAGQDTTQRKIIRKPNRAEFDKDVRDHPELSDYERLSSDEEENAERKRDWKY